MLLSGLLLASGTALLFGAWSWASDPSSVGPTERARRPALSEHPVLQRLLPLSRRLIDRWQDKPALQFLAAMLRCRLQRLAWPLGLTEQEWLGLSLLAGMVGFVVCGLCLHPGLALFGGVLGLVGPWFGLARQLAGQERQLLRLAPAWLETLALHLASGTDLATALRRQADRGREDILKRHVVTLLRQLEAGESLEVALCDFEARLYWDWFRPIVASLRDALRSGAPLAPLCRQQASDLHERRYESAERQAAAATVKLLLPLLLIFAAVLLILLGPLFLQMLGDL